MKKLTLLSIAILFAGILVSCNSNNAVKTIENLKTAYNGESTASAKYADFAIKAKAEGYDTLAIMFRATSEAEAIHASNHKKILEKMGVKIEKPTLGKYEVKTTKENLMDAIKGESYEISTMYPEFIKAAELEKAPDAIKTFTWALDTEIKHKDFYQKTLDEITKTMTEVNLALEWFTCPICGNTYSINDIKDACDFCMTPKEKFIKFN